MNPNKKILDLRGEEYRKSFPTQKELDRLPKIKSKNAEGKEIETPDLDKLEKETIGNVIFNCLMNYIVEDRKEGAYINVISLWILNDCKEGGKKTELKEKIKSFLIEVLDEQTLRRKKVKAKDEKGKEEEKEEVKGLYQAWVMSKIKEELGIEENDKA